jgi:hypothetical protein
MARELHDDPNVSVTAFMPYTLRQQVVALARLDGATLSEEVRRGLQLLLEARATEREDKMAVA